MRTLLFFLLATSAAAQPQLFLLPNLSSPSPTVTPYTLNPFLPFTTFQVQPGATNFLVHPDGTKYYSIARTPNDTLLVLSAANPATVLKRQNLAQAEASALTPNGQRLLVLGSSLSIFETANDNLLSTLPNLDGIDLAVNRDSTRAFVLSSNSLTAIDLSTNAILPNPLTFTDPTTAVVTGLNGLIYVSTTNHVYEIDPRTLAVRADIPVNARPSRLAFTPDGRYAVATNLTPVTGTSVLLIDLATRTVPSNFPNFQVTLDSLTVSSNNRIYATSTQSATLFEISISPFTVNPTSFSSVRAVAATLEQPTPRSTFVLTTTQLLRQDNTTNPPTPTSQLSGPTNPGPLFFRAAATTGSPSLILPYNNSQSTTLGNPFLPVIARVLDATGRPLRNVAVSFSSNLPAAPVQAATVFTDNEGFAQTTVSPPGNLTTFQVTALAAPAPAVTYTLTTTTALPGASNTLSIVRGQGQIVQEQFQVTNPLTVLVRTAAGAPVANQSVTFTLSSGQGTFNIFTSAGVLIPNLTCSGTICTGTTDAEGRAAVGFVATSVPAGSSYTQQTITASANSRSVNFLLTTILGGLSTPPVVERLAPTGNILTGAAGSTIADAIRVRVVVVSGPQSGQPIPNVALRASTANQPGSGPTAQCAGPGDVALTDSTGTATCNLTLGPTTGLAALEVNIGGFVNLGGSSLNIDVRGGPPTLTGSFPFSGLGASNSFTFNVTHSDGLSRIGIVNLLINSSLDARNACYLAYSVPQRVLYLVNDAGPDAGLSPGLVIGSPNTGSIANAQCRVFASGSSAVVNGNNITLTFNLSFFTNFAGSKVIYLAARTTDELTQGWTPNGVHEVPLVTQTFPNSATTNPGSGTAANALITFTYRDATATANLQTLWGLTNTALDGRAACYFAYHSPSNTLFLTPDDGNGAQASSIPFSGSNIIENSQCRINAFGSVVSRTGNTLSLSLNITYKPAFSGAKIIWTAASTLSNVITQWKASGAWQIPGN